jgi:hypothetical protein
MRKIILASLLAIIGLLFTPALVQANYISGWDNIRPLLLDGEGSEFVKPITGLPNSLFSEPTEFQAVQLATTWVADNMQYESDEGEVWTSSDQQYWESPRLGDCEDYAILLTALLRFHTQGGIPANRVWVVAGLVTLPGTDEVVVGHAWVAYKLEKGGMAYIEPQTGNLYRGNLGGGMLQFNDQWVKGGGYFLHNPNL